MQPALEIAHCLVVLSGKIMGGKLKCVSPVGEELNLAKTSRPRDARMVPPSL